MKKIFSLFTIYFVFLILYAVTVKFEAHILIQFVLLLYFIFLCFVILFWLYVKTRKKNYIHSNGEDILIIAPHQDDCVIIAGGYAIQTKEKGGRVSILYITDGYEDDKIIRKQEAIDAWRVIGIKPDSLYFLKYHCLTSLISRDEIESCITDVSEYIKKIEPDTIFIPLYEGGNYQHDVTNYMVRQIIDRYDIKADVYEALEYNFFFSFKTTPERILSAFSRFIPFYTYDYPPEPIREDTLFQLKMTQEQLALKKQMLAKFTTQDPDMLVLRFGFEDRYQKFYDYDYTLSPFNYERSLAKIINRLKKVPVLGKFVHQTIIWTRTIHPDPNYEITKIPL